METKTKAAETDYRITPREKHILQLVVNGYSNREIAEEFGISVRTVEAHRQNLFRKFQVDNVVKMVRLALEMRLIN